MTSEEVYKELTRIYNHYRKEFFDLDYKNFSIKKEKPIVLNFIELLNQKYSLHTLDHNFLSEYTEFQFNYWKESSTQFEGTNAFANASWIYGKKAFLRWFKVNQHIHWINDKKKKDTQIQSYKKRNIPQSIPFVVQLSPIEELDKKLYHNTEDGLLNCLENTTLYNHKSNLCLTCIFSERCIPLLEEQYPSILNLRESFITYEYEQ